MINERANNPKFLNKQIYKKNNKIHGQTLRITKKSIPKILNQIHTIKISKNSLISPILKI